MIAAVRARTFALPLLIAQARLDGVTEIAFADAIITVLTEGEPDQ